MRWLSASCGACLVGCAADTSGSSRPASADLKPGVTILKSDPAWGVNAAYKSPTNGHVVYMETRVGPLKPKAYRDEFPNSPPNEMDARIVDENGYTFTLVIGGDKLIDPTWAADLKAGEAARPTDPAVSAMFFGIAHESGPAFAAAAPPSLVHHVTHLINAARIVPALNTELNDRATLKIHEAIKAGVITKLDTVGYHYLEGDLYTECIVGCAGYHSVVWGWDGNYDFTTSSWNWTNNIVACNHGDCANSGNVSYSGTSGYSGGTTGSWYQSPAPLANVWSDEPTGDLSTTSGHGCQTGYNWDTPPGHECNDDSAYELWQINDSINNGGYGNTSHGDGSNFAWTSASSGCGFWGNDSCSYSCDCGNNVQCHGDWNPPPAP